VKEYTVKHKPLATLTGSIHAEFGFSPLEVFRCTLCGVNHGVYEADGFMLAGYVITPTPLCPVTGVVGICKDCIELVSPRIFSGEAYRIFHVHGKYEHKVWRPPVEFIQVGSEPLYVIRRGFADDDRIAAVVADVWRHIPRAGRVALRRHLRTRKVHWLDNGPLRIEALPDWPGRYRTIGECWNRGHAIGLVSTFVQAMPDEVLATLIAHEIGHSHQFATRKRFQCRKDAENDVVALISGWGYENPIVGHWYSAYSHEKSKERMHKPAAGIASESKPSPRHPLTR
jgi:hypothetical protein